MLAGEIHRIARQRLHDDVIRLDIGRLRPVRIDSPISQLVRRGAAADADLDAASAQMIEHADFFGEPQRVMRRQHIDQGAEAKASGALRNRRQKNARRRRQIERRRVVLAHMIGAEAAGVVQLDQLEAVLILLMQRIRPMVVLIEYAELQRIDRGHGHLPDSSFLAARGRIF